MARLAQVKSDAVHRYARGDVAGALHLCAAIVQAAPLDFEARLKVADCLVALGTPAAAIPIYRAVGWYGLKAGHPLVAVVCARVLESLGGEAADLLAALVVQYGSESELIGRFAGRISLPADDTEIPVGPPAPDLPARAAQLAATCTDRFDEYPAAVHPIPLLSELSEDAFRRVLGTLVVGRLPAGAVPVREGDPGESFFFVATGTVRVVKAGAGGAEIELARLAENAVFGEMALLSAQPRTASVQVVREADLLEVTRESLAALADELSPVAVALHRFTRDRLLSNLLATSPLFRPFSGTQRRDLLRRFTSHDVAAGTDVIAQGEEGRGLFVVLSGEVDVFQSAPDGTRTRLATLRTGDVFGEMSLVRGDRTSATVTAARPSTVLFLAKNYVDRIVAGIPEIRGYLEALAEDRDLDTRLATAAPEPDDDSAVLV
jgi:cAMP-dependent protein kinase regulator